MHTARGWLLILLSEIEEAKKEPNKPKLSKNNLKATFQRQILRRPVGLLGVFAPCHMP